MSINRIIAITLLCLASGSSLSLMAQETAKSKEGLEVSGYIQLYYQAGERDAILSIGEKQESDMQSFARLGMRRGHTKLSYTKGLARAVLQIDLTERGVKLKDAYVRLVAPFLKQSALQVGIFNRPFGHEIGYSSLKRESPERALIIRTLFPNERDLGVMLSFSGNKSSFWQSWHLDAGLFSGQGIKSDVDSHLDFIGRLSQKYKFGINLEVGLGVSLYYGGVYQNTPELFSIVGDRFVREENSEYVGQFARRSYLGIDAQIAWQSVLGRTVLRSEWLRGQQPSSSSNSQSPNGQLQTSAMYLRPVSGGYALLTQGVGCTPLSIIAKYDWYDPNIALSGDIIGDNHSSKADLAYHTLGIGAMYQLSNALKLTLYGEQVWNERTKQIAKFENDLKDNRLTLALLYKF